MERRNWAMVRLFAWSITAAALIVILFLGITGKINWISFSLYGGYHYADAKRYTPGGADLDADEVEDLDINWIDGRVQIEVYDGDTVQFHENTSRNLKEAEQLQYYNKNGRLIIQYQKSQRKVLSTSLERHKELIVKIPEKIAESMGFVGVDTISSETKITGITAKNINLDSTSGEFKLKGCRALKIMMNSTSGDLIGESIVAEELLTVDTVSGDAEVEGSIADIDFSAVSGDLTAKTKVCPQNVKTDTVSGSVYLTIPDNKGFTYSKDTVSGSMTCDFNTINKEDEGTYKDGDAEFEFESVSGDFTIKKL